MLLDLFCLMDRFALKLRCAVRAPGGCKRDLGLAERAVTGMNVALGGTSVIILVGVALDTVRSLESQMMMRHYKGFLE